MRKKVLALFLALWTAFSLEAAPVRALGAFSDVTNETVARNVEILQLMGVISGDNGLFRPNSKLTRAEFCKMAITFQDRGKQAVSYRSRTIFPDVRPSHWAAGYINLAAIAPSEDTQAMMHGFPDGTFRPDDSITYGEAVTVLMRALGYTDSDSGGVWPQGYMDLAAAKELTSGVQLSGSSTLTRAQAAQLFVNALSVKTPENKTLKTLSDETVLLSVDVSDGKLKTTEKKLEMTHPSSITMLLGLRGKLVMDEDGKVLTFLPSASKEGKIVGNGAVIVSADGSSVGLEALTGNTAGYAVYRNGIPSSVRELKRGDVVIYSAVTNSLLACDTRVEAIYESASPSVSAPATIKSLGTSFSVLPTAQQSLSLFKPGDKLVLLFTADGRIAGAAAGGRSDNSGNALAYVGASSSTNTGTSSAAANSNDEDDEGWSSNVSSSTSESVSYGSDVSLICAGNLLALNCSVSGGSGVRVGRISQDKNGVYVTDQRTATGMLDTTARQLGNLSISDNALIIDENGKQTTLSELPMKVLPADQIRYAHTGDSGKIDVLVLGESLGSNEFFGRVEVYYEDNIRHIRLNYGGSIVADGYATYNSDVQEGDIVYLRSGNTSGSIQKLEKLSRFSGVPESAWLNDYAVNVAGETCSVPLKVAIYNKDNETWMSSVEEAREYGGAMILYVRDSVVRFIEVSK